MKSPELDHTQASSYELGWTLNPITGCLNHVNGMCKGGGFPCYAYALANGRLKSRYLANPNLPLHALPYSSYMADPFYPRLWPDRLNEDLGICRGIFVVDMGDLFGIGVPEEWTREVLDRIRRSSHRNRYYLLTKQPQNLAKFSPFPDNCWIGVTATSRGRAWEADKHLGFIDAKVKYLSLEPLLEWSKGDFGGDFLTSTKATWVIIGAQSKPTVYPKFEWIKEIVEAADDAKLPIFMKDNLKPLLGDNLRQEMPNE